MKIKVGSARINEFGEISGGIPGDQTGKECMIEDAYVHELGWVIIRAKKDEQRRKIAQDMVYICNNDLIGYDQPKDESLLEVVRKFGYNASKVNQACDCDCAKAVRVCVLYAGIECETFYTGNEINVLEKTGAFEIIRDKTYCSNMQNYIVGDILCTPVKGHTCVVVSTDGGTELEGFEFYCDTRQAGEWKTNGTANIRQFGGTESKIMGIAPNNAVVLADGIICYETALNKRWLHIDYFGLTGFVSENMIYKK